MMKVPHNPSAWRKSSYSAEETDCIELANTFGALRDSKNPAGPALSGVDALSLLATVKAGRLDR